MEKQEAVQEVENIGRGYFYDVVVVGEKISEFDMTDDEIFAQIREDVLRTASRGLVYWEKPRDALQVVLTECL